jgi:hypothetical protein
MAAAHVASTAMGNADKIPVVAAALGIRVLRLNSVEDRPAPKRLTRDRLPKENRFVRALCSILDAFKGWVSDDLALAASFHPMRLAHPSKIVRPPHLGVATLGRRGEVIDLVLGGKGIVENDIPY